MRSGRTLPDPSEEARRESLESEPLSESEGVESEVEDVWEDERSVAKEWGSEGVGGVESEVEMCGRTRGLSESEGVES